MKTMLSIALLAGLGYNVYAQDFGEFNSNEELSLPVPEMEADKSGGGDRGGEKEWTMMVFMNAKNNLEEFGIGDVNEMESVGSSSKVNVIVQLGRMDGYDATNGDWKGAKIFYVKKDTDTAKIQSKVVKNIGSINMGDYKEVIKFAKWTKENYPAKKYALIIWDHGSGWEKGNPVTDKGISDDFETGNNIDTPQMGKIAAQVGDLEIMASDACLMQMAEVVYEFKDSPVKYMLGSEEIMPRNGYPYDTILGALAGNPGMDGAALSKVVVSNYIASVSKPQATHSAVDMSKAAELAPKMDEFAKAAMVAADTETIKAARDGARKFDTEDNKDLKHFADLVKEKTKDEKLKAAAEELSKFIAVGSVLTANEAKTPNANGLAVYLPEAFVDGDYNEIKLAKDTQWDEFLKWQVKIK